MRLTQPYKQLGDLFYAEVEPTPVSSPSWIIKNESLATELGIESTWFESAEALSVFSGQSTLPSPKPVAMAYAGHQFGHWVPILGDGRALLLGEHTDSKGQRWDIQLKGSGPTPFSRNGDGRSSIGPVAREYLASEAMAALGIPTTRALAAIATGEVVQRQGPEPGGIVVRVAKSHIRIGTFEYFARQGQTDAVQALLNFVIERHHPDLAKHPEAPQLWYQRIIKQTAELISQWMQVGFIHGVMNTDNMSVIGETLDYGPFGFLDSFHPETVYSSIDQTGRYAYNQQPAVATWNLARLAECLLPLFSKDDDEAMAMAKGALNEFPHLFKNHFNAGITKKVGLDSTNPNHESIALEFLDLMASQDADMTLAFRALSKISDASNGLDDDFYLLFDDPQAIQAWLAEWRRALDGLGQDERVRQAQMQQKNPAFILRNHLAQRAVDAAIDKLDFEPMHRLLGILSHPFDDQPTEAEWAGPPAPHERVVRTFCGT